MHIIVVSTKKSISEVHHSKRPNEKKHIIISKDEKKFSKIQYLLNLTNLNEGENPQRSIHGTTTPPTPRLPASDLHK